MKFRTRLNQMDRAELIEYIRELEGEIAGYEDAEAERILESDWEDNLFVMDFDEEER